MQVESLRLISLYVLHEHQEIRRPIKELQFADTWKCRCQPLPSFGRPLLPGQFRHRPMIADKILGPSREVVELRGGDIDAQTLVERGEDVAEMNRPAAWLF